MIVNDYFTALPAGRNAIILLHQYRQLLIKNLIGYLTAIQSSSLDIDISFLIKKYETLDIKENFSPAIYALFSKLIKVSSDGDVPPIVDVLHQLSILKEEDIHNSEFMVSTILTEPWENDFVNKIRTETIPSENDQKTIILPVINPDLSELTKAYTDVFEFIGKIDLEFYQEILCYVTRLKLFNGKGLTATTSSSVFGAVYLNLPMQNEDMEPYFCEHIIHETSHLQLEILFAFDKIVLNKETEKFKSPLRTDPRPILGIFHATFVLSRMVRLFKRIVKQRPGNEYVKKLELFRRQFDQGLETVEKNAILTEKGKLILNSFTKAAEI
jgi:hypothetical protein